MSMKRVGTIVFVVGLVLAVLLGAVADLFIESVIVAFFIIVVLLGLVVGMLTSAKEETEDVLYTTAAVVVTALAATSLDNVAPDMFGSFIVGAAQGVIAYLFAVALVVGAKRIYDLGTGF